MLVSLYSQLVHTVANLGLPVTLTPMEVTRCLKQFQEKRQTKMCVQEIIQECKQNITVTVCTVYQSL